MAFSNEIDQASRVTERCRQLNNESSILKDGRKPFVVVSGRLMERTILASSSRQY